MRCTPIQVIRAFGFIIVGLSVAVRLTKPSLVRLDNADGGSVGEDSFVLRREIDAIQELLDEQPDSKCTPPLYSVPMFFSLILYRVHGVNCLLQTPSPAEALSRASASRANRFAIVLRQASERTAERRSGKKAAIRGVV